MAQELATRLLGAATPGNDGGDVYNLVQLSQSSSYQDFIQGVRGGSKPQQTAQKVVEEVLRIAANFLVNPEGDAKSLHEKNLLPGLAPAVGGAAAQFAVTSEMLRVVDGPLVQLGRVRNGDAENSRRVLVVDEMNRANVANVFGECFFLLEAENRGKAIPLRYSGPFCLSPNLFLIGTMNLADRNINQQMDCAFVQRFAWVELRPEKEPVRGLLQAWLRKHISWTNLDTLQDDVCDTWLPKLIEAWNEVLRTNRCVDFQIGPRYFRNHQLLTEDKSNLKGNQEAARIVKEVCESELRMYLRHVLRGFGDTAETRIFKELDEATQVLNPSVPGVSGGDDGILRNMWSTFII